MTERTSVEVELYPLQHVDDFTFKELCKVLWEWRDCGTCANSGRCGRNTCEWRRSGVLQPYFEFYQNATIWDMPEDVWGARPALRHHQDLRNIIELLKARPDDSCANLMTEYFTTYGDAIPDEEDQHLAFGLAVKIMTTVRSVPRSLNTAKHRTGCRRVVWKRTDTLRTFMDLAFPLNNVLNLEDDYGSSIRHRFSADWLKRVRKFGFQRTDDLARHFVVDWDTRTIEIYHHTAFLKECLIASRGNAGTASNVMPRQLALETLDSIQTLLFPMSDDKSRRILEELVDKMGFDKDCLEIDSFGFRMEDEDEYRFQIWADRLLTIKDTMDSPRSRRVCWGRLELKSKPVYLMLITLVGVILATLLAAGSFGVGVFDTFHPGGIKPQT